MLCTFHVQPRLFEPFEQQRLPYTSRLYVWEVSRELATHEQFIVQCTDDSNAQSYRHMYLTHVYRQAKHPTCPPRGRRKYVGHAFAERVHTILLLPPLLLSYTLHSMFRLYVDQIPITSPNVRAVYMHCYTAGGVCQSDLVFPSPSPSLSLLTRIDNTLTVNHWPRPFTVRGGRERGEGGHKNSGRVSLLCCIERLL